MNCKLADFMKLQSFAMKQIKKVMNLRVVYGDEDKTRVCQNCGRAHSGTLVERFRDGDNKWIEIIVCREARYK